MLMWCCMAWYSMAGHECHDGTCQWSEQVNQQFASKPNLCTLASPPQFLQGYDPRLWSSLEQNRTKLMK
jgi:hypothetical protein